MADHTAPSAEEIMALARQVHQLAVKQRGELELVWVEKGLVPDSAILDNPHANGGTSADWARLSSQYAWIVEMFANSIGPDPSGFDPLVQSMIDAEQALMDSPPLRLSTDLSAGSNEALKADVDKADSILAQWSGTAAQSFRDNFLLRLPETMANQALVALSLREAANANKAVYTQCRIELKELAEKAQTALEFMNRSNGPSVAVTLGVIAAVMTVSAGIATGPVGWAGGLTIAAGIFSGAGTIAGAPSGTATNSGTEYTISADTVDGMLSQVCDGISTIRSAVQQGEDNIINALSGNYDVVMNGSSSGNPFVAPGREPSSTPETRSTRAGAPPSSRTSPGRSSPADGHGWT